MTRQRQQPPIPFPWIVLPELHASLGFGFFLAFHVALPPAWFVWALGILELILLLKETVVDPLLEGPTQPFFWEGAQDFFWYQVGFAIALLVVFA